MTVTYLKRGTGLEEDKGADTSAAVSKMLTEIRAGGDKIVSRYARDLDGWTGPVICSREEMKAAAEKVPDNVKADIQFAHQNIKRFAQAQRDSMQAFEMDMGEGFQVGQKHIPVTTAGCYVPGGRYSHIASAIMTITTAKVAGVKTVIACSPTRPEIGIPPSILYTMDLCGADHVLNLGGVQGIASMAFGLFDLPKADVLAGPGNQYVAEAKRLLFGEVGIDMFAGPTDSMVIADKTADPLVVAYDLVGQAEHGYNSPVWLVSDDRSLAETVLRHVPDLIADLPEPNRESARLAWENLGEVMLCGSRAEMVEVANRYAPEHLHVQCSDLNWWREHLNAYGSLFLGEETTVAFGDKASGPNHVLPTSGAARYTGGLSVQKFMKTVTWQQATRAACLPVAGATARISRLEGMEGHARSADIRIQKYGTSSG